MKAARATSHIMTKGCRTSLISCEAAIMSISRITAPSIPLELHIIAASFPCWLTLTMLPTECRQLVRLSAVLWHGISDEQAVRVAGVNREGYTVVDVMTLLLTHDAHTFLCNSANKKSTDRSTTICACRML